MGSNSSKPIKESARSVLARRKKDIIDNNITISSPSVSSQTITSSPPSTTATGQSTIDRINNYVVDKNNLSKIIGPNDGLDLDPKILNH